MLVKVDARGGGLLGRLPYIWRVVVLSVGLLLDSSGQVQLPKGWTGMGAEDAKRQLTTEALSCKRPRRKTRRGSRNSLSEDDLYKP